MLFSNEISRKTNMMRDKILVICKKNNLHNEMYDLNKQNTNAEKAKLVEQVNQLNPNEGLEKKVKTKNDTVTKKNIASSSIMIERYKKNKMDRINGELQHDKKEFFYQDDLKNNDIKKNGIKDDKKSVTKEIKQNNISSASDNKSLNSKSDSLEKDAPVFKVAKSKISESLTLADKAKLLSVVSKLSAIDYEKANKYLEGGSVEDIKNVIKLLKERLSEKDYDKVKEVASKFINMDMAD
jgi:hypothetical protein